MFPRLILILYSVANAKVSNAMNYIIHVPGITLPELDISQCQNIAINSNCNTLQQIASKEMRLDICDNIGR